MSALFEIPQSLSPRLKWMREHGITVSHHAETKRLKEFWTAQCGAIAVEESTEHGALAALAIRLGIRLWNGS
jgi:hypothetical protein